MVPRQIVVIGIQRQHDAAGATDNTISRDEAEIARVTAIVSVITHHEIVPLRYNPLPITGTAAVMYQCIVIRIPQLLPIK